MFSRLSIYDRLSEREPPSLANEVDASKPLNFSTDSLLLDDVWCCIGSGDVDQMLESDIPPFSCDYTYDSRIRDTRGRYLGIANIEIGIPAKLKIRSRANQLLRHALHEITSTHKVPAEKQYKVIMRVPAGMNEDDWLDDVLGQWPIHLQPSLGIEIIDLDFDEWLAMELKKVSGETEYLQFIEFNPLTPPTILNGVTAGESVVSLWLRRRHETVSESWAIENNRENSRPLQLMRPGYHAHESRTVLRRSHIEHMVSAIDFEKHEIKYVKAVIWDGVHQGYRLDQMITLFQSYFTHLYFDVDLWMTEGICGSLSNATSMHVVLATLLAWRRQGDALIIDSHDEVVTKSLYLKY